MTYLRSDGYEEYKNILGFIGPIIYHLMFSVVSKTSYLIGCNKECFYNLMLSMNYKKSKEPDTYYYTGENKRKTKFINLRKNENPFKKLLALNLK